MNMPVRQTNPLAIVSLISGIVGMLMIPLIGSLAAIITGHMARSQIRDSADGQAGSGMALTGLVLGYLGIFLIVVAGLLAYWIVDGTAL